MLSRIAEGSVFVGDIRSRGRLRVEGEVRGRVRAREVLVSPSAVVKGPIRTKRVVIGGTVVGDVVAATGFVLHDDGYLVGNVYRNRRRRLSPASKRAAPAPDAETSPQAA